jgi:hypothetical protein
MSHNLFVSSGVVMVAVRWCKQWPSRLKNFNLLMCVDEFRELKPSINFGFEM